MIRYLKEKAIKSDVTYILSEDYVGHVEISRAPPASCVNSVCSVVSDV